MSESVIVLLSVCCCVVVFFPVLCALCSAVLCFLFPIFRGCSDTSLSLSHISQRIIIIYVIFRLASKDMNK